MKKIILTFFLTIHFNQVFAGEGSKIIVTSIRPIESILLNIIEDTDLNSELLIDSKMSPHHARMKPKDLKLVNEADIVFYIDDHFENFIVKPSKRIKQKIVELSKEADLSLLRQRDLENWPQNLANNNLDYHLWLDPDNALVIAKIITRELNIIYPEYKRQFSKNLGSFSKKISKMDTRISKSLREVSEKKFIVYHDAFQYFEQKYHLKSIAAILYEPEYPASGKRIKEIRRIIRGADPKCVFYEEGHGEKILKNITEGLEIEMADIDVLGNSYARGKGLYFSLIKNLAKDFKTCLAAH